MLKKPLDLEHARHLMWHQTLAELAMTDGNMPWTDFTLAIEILAMTQNAGSRIDPNDIARWTHNCHMHNTQHLLIWLRGDNAFDRKRVRKHLRWHLRRAKENLSALNITQRELNMLVAKPGKAIDSGERTPDENDAQIYFMTLVSVPWDRLHTHNQLKVFAGPVGAFLLGSQLTLRAFVNDWYKEYQQGAFRASDRSRQRLRSAEYAYTAYCALYTAHSHLLPDDIRAVLAPTP